MARTVNYYDSTGTKVVRTREYRSAALAWAAIKRAQRRGQIAMVAGVRTVNYSPTVHH